MAFRDPAFMEKKSLVVRKDPSDSNYFDFFVEYDTICPAFGDLPELRIPHSQRVLSAHFDDLQNIPGFELALEFYDLESGTKMEIEFSIKLKEEAQ